MFGFIHDIEWMRAYTRKNQRKIHRKNIRRNYRRIHREIRFAAKQGFNKTSIRFMVYEENVRRLVSEGYAAERKIYYGGSPVWEVVW